MKVSKAAFCLGALLLAATDASADENVISPERRASEACVWEFIQEQRARGADVSNIDAQIMLGNAAVDACAAQLQAWAEASPAVRERGDSVEEITAPMHMHYAARGALFAAGRARPFYEEEFTPAAPSSGVRTAPTLRVSE